MSGSWARHGALPQKQIANSVESNNRCAARDSDQLGVNSMFSLTVFHRLKAMVIATVSNASVWAHVKMECLCFGERASILRDPWRVGEKVEQLASYVALGPTVVQIFICIESVDESSKRVSMRKAQMGLTNLIAPPVRWMPESRPSFRRPIQGCGFGFSELPTARRWRPPARCRSRIADGSTVETCSIAPMGEVSRQPFHCKTSSPLGLKECNWLAKAE